MTGQVSPLFDEVEAQARRYRDPYRVARAAVICKMAREHQEGIEEHRVYRHKMREIATREPKRNGSIALLDMHPVELEAISFLCSDFRAPNAQRQKDGLKWVKKQPWAKEFLPPEFAKERF